DRMSVQGRRRFAWLLPERDRPTPFSFGRNRTVVATLTRYAPPMAQTRILLIEDERALTNVLAYNLEREGYEVTVAHDGQEGLRKAQTQPVDLILLDLMLPAVSGLDVCREIRAGELTKDIPIIMLTAKAEETDQ